jgi:hypothetical protein
MLVAGMTSSPADIQAAVGTGTVPAEFSYSGFFAGATGLSDLSTTSSGTVQVTYNYSTLGAVPLPDSLEASLSALAALGLLRLGKAAKKSLPSNRLA